MGTIRRTALVDNTLPDGSDGTPWSDAQLQLVYDAVEGDVRSPNNPTTSSKSIIDNFLAGLPVLVGGDPDIWIPYNAYPAGAVYWNTGGAAGAQLVLAPGSRIWLVDSALLQEGTYRLEAMLQVDNAAAVAHVGLFNLTDSPNAAPVAEAVSNANGPGGFIYQSAPIVWPAPGATKSYGIKVYASPAGYRAKAWAARVVRTA